MKTEINWDGIREGLSETLTASLQGVVEGTQDDLAAFGEEIAASSVTAAMLGDQARLDELHSQILGIAEASRLRAVNASWSAMAQTVMAVTRAVILTATNITIPGA